jgi:hypothetical protein
MYLLFNHGSTETKFVSELFLHPSYRSIEIGPKSDDEWNDLQGAAAAQIAVVSIPNSFREGLRNVKTFNTNEALKGLISNWACLVIVAHMVKSAERGSDPRAPPVVVCYEIDLEGGNGVHGEARGQSEDVSAPTPPGPLMRTRSLIHEHPRPSTLKRASSSMSYQQHVSHQRRLSLRLPGTLEAVVVEESNPHVHDPLQQPTASQAAPKFDSDPTSQTGQIVDYDRKQAVSTSDSAPVSEDETVVDELPAVTPPALRLSRILVSCETVNPATGGSDHTATAAISTQLAADMTAVAVATDMTTALEPIEKATSTEDTATTNSIDSSEVCFAQIFTDDERNRMKDADVRDSINVAVGELIAWGLTFDRETWNFISSLTLFTLMEQVCCGLYNERGLSVAFWAITGEKLLRDGESANRKDLEQLTVENLIDLFKSSGLQRLIRTIAVRRINGAELIHCKSNWDQIFGFTDLDDLHAHYSAWIERKILVMSLEGDSCSV